MSDPGYNAPLPIVDLIVVCVYLIGVLAFGCWFMRRTRTPEQFMAAGRRIPGWAVGLSIFGTYVSSISFLALPGKAYGADWNAFVFSLALPLTTWIAVRWFVPFYRKSGEVSAYAHLEHRFGPWARSYAALCYVLTQIARMGTIMYLTALALSPLIGWSMVTLILLTSVLVIAYTLVGGMEAVIWTDVVQSVILITGAIACLAILCFGMPAGPAQIFEIAAEHGKFSLGSLSLDMTDPAFWAESTFWVVLVYGVFMNLQNFGIDQSYVQRYQTARSDQDAARSVWGGALLYLPVSALFFFIGTALFAFYTARPELLADAVRAGGKADEVFPHFIVSQLPVGATGLVLAAIFAAAQSTLSSSINCSATLILRDGYQRYFRPGASERESLFVLKCASFGVGLLGTLAALAMMRVQSALDAWWQLAGIFSGGMLGLFLLGLISRRARNPEAIAGVLLGFAVIVYMTFSPAWTGDLARFRSPFHSFLIVVMGTLAILLVGLILSRFRTRRAGQQ
jgi:SSS family solute:Na+ symporter